MEQHDAADNGIRVYRTPEIGLYIVGADSLLVCIISPFTLHSPTTNQTNSFLA